MPAATEPFVFVSGARVGEGATRGGSGESSGRVGVPVSGTVEVRYRLSQWPLVVMDVELAQQANCTDKGNGEAGP